MSGDASYLRCRHCRGFSETSFSACKWCEYDTPFVDVSGAPRVFPDRETCRAIQFAEYEQLPPEAHADPMGPPKNELTLLLNCLHCGPDGHPFEAIEMRWMANERQWACPCTTCGGRGFGIDLHSAENRWQCAECGHFYTPAGGDYRCENAKCPKCGCTEASGWFDDDYDEEDFEKEFGSLPPGDPNAPAGLTEDEIPWDQDEVAERQPGNVEYDLGISWQESDEGEELEGPYEHRLPDDIDHPHERSDSDLDLNDDDIPF